MPTNDNYNRNEPDGSDNNHQSTTEVDGGELRNGRLSQQKNSHPMDKEVPNEYLNHNKGEETI